MKKIVTQGSAKDYTINKDEIEFYFSDRYSIFDWGEMPDNIPDKGKYLKEIAAFFFHYLESKGIKTAFKRENKDSLICKHFPAYKPIYKNQNYEYSTSKYHMESHLIPLEVIFRHSITPNSSILKRLKKSQLDLDSYDRFKNVNIEYTTKLEPKDRFLEAEEAFKISGLDEELFLQMECICVEISLILKEYFSSIDIELIDGKLEFAYDKITNAIVLIDSIGPDELRLSYKEIKLSKQILRDYYINTEWGHHLKKKQQIQPKKLPMEFIETTALMYQALAKAITKSNKIPETTYELILQNQSFQNILVIGEGSREYSLCTELAKSPLVENIFYASNNVKPFSSIKIKNFNWRSEKLLVSFCKKEKIDLVIIGPENLLANGLADRLRENSINCLGPDKEISQIESSKSYSKKLMLKLGIPTASYYEFNSFESGIDYIDKSDEFDGFVIKADGLASGKGVYVCDSKAQAKQAIKQLSQNKSIKTNSHFLIEEKLLGKELSAFALFDKTTYRFLGTACDYKRIRDKDEGPNTGGMGSYSPCDFIDNNDYNTISEHVFDPILTYFRENNIDFRGVLFAGLIKTDKGIKVIEFNVRFGDPETQSLLPRIQNDLALLFSACSQSKLENQKEVTWKNDFCVHVVLAAKGYPGTEGINTQTGDKVKIDFDKLKKEKVDVTLGGIQNLKNNYVTSGGRVMGLSSIASSKDEAVSRIYKNINAVSFTGMQYRKDIGK